MPPVRLAGVPALLLTPAPHSEELDWWLQWFGGFDSEPPLIISPRLPTELFENLLEQLKGPTH